MRGAVGGHRVSIAVTSPQVAAMREFHKEGERLSHDGAAGGCNHTRYVLPDHGRFSFCRLTLTRGYNADRMLWVSQDRGDGACEIVAMADCGGSWRWRRRETRRLVS